VKETDLVEDALVFAQFLACILLPLIGWAFALRRHVKKNRELIISIFGSEEKFWSLLWSNAFTKLSCSSNELSRYPLIKEVTKLGWQANAAMFFFFIFWLAYPFEW
jgi:hypothetical protein